MRPLPQLATALLVLPVVVLVTAAGLRRLEHRTLRSLALGFDHRWGKAVALGLALGALTPALVATLLRVGGYARIAPEPLTVEGLVGATLPMTLAVALAELGGPMLAAGLTGVVFGLLHGGNPGANPGALAITAWNGTLLAWVVTRTGSLWLACGYHAGWNLMAALTLGLRDSPRSSRQ